MLDKIESLIPEVRRVVEERATEAPFTGRYNEEGGLGSYLCRRCGLALFRSSAKFPSGCGWPSFDEEVPGHVAKQIDPDGRRTEIHCVRCLAHLGHVFSGEGFTANNLRHCVNSVSLDFVKDTSVEDSEEVIVAAGCFWGVEYYFRRLPGVLKTEVGYTGGQVSRPSYKQVCTGNTGHVEAVRVLYDPSKLNAEAVIKYFFEIHDPNQGDGQGPDRGAQYLSRIFYYDEDQNAVAESVLNLLREKGYRPTTGLMPVSIFWPAEDYHQAYYQKQDKEPYCHRHEKRF